MLLGFFLISVIYASSRDRLAVVLAGFRVSLNPKPPNPRPLNPKLLNPAWMLRAWAGLAAGLRRSEVAFPGNFRDVVTHRLHSSSGLHLGSYKVIPRRNYYGAHGYQRDRNKQQLPLSSPDTLFWYPTEPPHSQLLTVNPYGTLQVTLIESAF